MKRTRIIAAWLVAAAGAAGTQAAQVDFLGMGFRKTVEMTHEGDYIRASAGEILINLDDSNLTAYCVDLEHSIVSSWTALASPVNDINGGKAAAYLYDTFHLGIANDVQAAALQVAIWEVIEDFGGPLDLNAGNFNLLTNGDVQTMAQSYLTALPIDLSAYETDSYIVKSDDLPRSQHLIVPEPATVAFLMFFAPLLIMRLRSKRMIRARAA